MIPETVRKRISGLQPHPTYLYNLDALQHHAKQVKQHLGRVRVLYAAKANPDPQILQTLHGIVDGFEVASGGEFRHVVHHHPDAQVSFGAPSKLPADLEFALRSGVHRIHVEGPRELVQLSDIARRLNQRAHILLRVNLGLSLPDAPLAMGGKPSPFGMDEVLLQEALTLLRKHPELVCHGVHLHLASGIRDAHRHAVLLQEALRWFEGFTRKHHLDWHEINLGGGMGVNYQHPEQKYDWATLGAALQQHSHLDLRIEPGRSMVAHCGYYATPILDIKKSHGETFLLLQGGTHHFRTPAAQGHSHPFEVINLKTPEVQDLQVHVVGQLCTPKDRLSSGAWISGAAVGDWVVFPMAGAYAWNISHTAFLMHPEPNFEHLSPQRQELTLSS
ncbi:alanine racemase [Deinococcus cellulosilyticus]|uniref:Diaminopimelate decarboxylase n=1 Tax=Deinococcus cellulosilyticus (strain DSM 18568 / NBRC 106333 / KACC 11606 / 5516J-15) TaxID=1223518 RepID=A0A511MWA1_DEIC1|nr:alanine racemase [Deinococcus cellulosilyticus]GEM44671.1 diaminopimelate decarboxylase [Deinococcus cellulosilyticus NBRC 106333 = KACC 11606]